jgi:hypothetical protein
MALNQFFIFIRVRDAVKNSRVNFCNWKNQKTGIHKGIRGEMDQTQRVRDGTDSRVT